MLAINFSFFKFLGLHGIETQLRPGYLMGSPATITKFSWYWLQNIGLHLFLIPLGFYLSPRKVKLIWLPAFFCFLLANTFQFSMEMAGNHKLINFFLIMSLPLSAKAFIFLWDKSKLIFKPLLAVIFVLLIQGGLIDFFPIYNDFYVALPQTDRGQRLMKWIEHNTSPSDRFLTNTIFMHPASLSGRRVFLSWPYFAWSAGYDTTSRLELINQLYKSRNFRNFCQVMTVNKLDWASVEEVENDVNVPRVNLADYLKMLIPEFYDPFLKMAIYSREKICSYRDH